MMCEIIEIQARMLLFHLKKKKFSLAHPVTFHMTMKSDCMHRTLFHITAKEIRVNAYIQEYNFQIISLMGDTLRTIECCQSDNKNILMRKPLTFGNKR